MFKKLVSHLSYANVMVTILMFIVLGGGAYAVGLKKNSVGPKQLKPNAVTGTDANEATFGTVPSASSADNASRLGGVSPSGFQRSCASGAVLGTLRINTTGFAVGDYVPVPGYNCADPGNTATSVQIRKLATGSYNVLFPGGGATGAAVASPENAGADIWVSPTGTSGEYVVLAYYDDTSATYTPPVLTDGLTFSLVAY